MSTFSALRRFLFSDNISPAVENTRSDGTDVAGMHPYFLTNVIKPSNAPSLVCQ